jgi:hypothetical protein
MNITGIMLMTVINITIMSIILQQAYLILRRILTAMLLLIINTFAVNMITIGP